jgi:hypothetical protein
MSRLFFIMCFFFILSGCENVTIDKSKLERVDLFGLKSKQQLGRL